VVDGLPGVLLTGKDARDDGSIGCRRACSSFTLRQRV